MNLLFCVTKKKPKQKTNSVALSPQVNYTDRVTATCRRNLVPTFVDRGMSRSQRGGTPTVVNLFSRPEPLLFFQVAPHLSSQGWVDPIPDPLLLRKYGITGNRTRDLSVSSQKLWPLNHRGGPVLCNTILNVTSTYQTLFVHKTILKVTSTYWTLFMKLDKFITRNLGCCYPYYGIYDV
jgi:hypothetical protein